MTASRRPEALGDTAASMLVLSSSDLKTTAGIGLDDALRQVPGFTLFRRTPSRGANPTTQGATLRGLAGSGASRALVLEDGVPLNDPFGGWIYWGRVPRAAVERVEVVRGGGSDLYGSSALAGVVQVLRADTEVPRLEGELDRGRAGSRRRIAFRGGPARRPGAPGWRRRSSRRPATSRSRTSCAGTVDRRLSTRHHGGDVTLERAIGVGACVRPRGRIPREPRQRYRSPGERHDDQPGRARPRPPDRRRADCVSAPTSAARTTTSRSAPWPRTGGTERLTSAQHVPVEHQRLLRCSGRVPWAQPRLRAGRGAARDLGDERRGQLRRRHHRAQRARAGASTPPALFVEDAWSLGRRLILQGGVRYDRLAQLRRPADGGGAR